MINCSKTKNFLREQNRMCIKYRSYPNACKECPLSSWSNKSPKGDLITCCDILSKEPQKAIEIVQQWSDAHLPRTILTDFLEHYPDTITEHIPNSLMENYPSEVSPCMLGLADSCRDHLYNPYSKDCQNCWNTLIDPSFKEGYEW